DPDDESALARLVARLERPEGAPRALTSLETVRRRDQLPYDTTPSPETDARIQAIRARQTPFANAAPAPRPIATPLIPARRRPWPRVLWPVVAGAVATATIGWLVASPPHRTSVAVLGLGNATRDTTLTYLAHGLA